MKLRKTAFHTCDVLVIGGGGAGLRSAIEARLQGASVMLVSKSRVGHAANTYISKSNIATSGLGDGRDNHVVHFMDTLRGGRNINDSELVMAMTE